MSDFVTTATIGEIPEGGAKIVTLGERQLAVFCDGGEYYALENACPHMGAPLALGDVRDGMVVCDRHLWRFRLRDGVCPDAPELKAETFDVRVKGDEIQVRVGAIR